MRRIFRAGLCVGFAILVAACATVAENTLPQARRDALRIDTVEVAFAPNARINWPDVFQDFAASGLPDTPQGRITYLEKRAGGKIRSNVEAQIRPVFRGTQPARLRVVIRRLEVPSLIQRILVGGDNQIAADITLIDAATGQILLSADFLGDAYAGGGIGAVAVDIVAQEAIVRVSTSFGKALAQWLKTGQALARN